MENLKISLNEDKKLNFDKYYFNGFPIPNNIKYIYDEYLNFQRSKDDFKKIDIDNNRLKFRLEIKEEKNEKFEQIYEGKDCFYNIKNLIRRYFL